MSELKGVVIGAGYFSQFHFDAWTRMPQVHLAAVCDANPEHAEQAATQHGIRRHYSDVDEMLSREKPDFVDIITRPDSHLPLTRQIAQSVNAIICQKPLAPHYQEAKELVEATDRTGTRLMVHENFRFQPWYREIKRLLVEGSLGTKIHSIQIRTRTGDGWQHDAYMARQPYFREMKRFLIFETGVHFIDTLRFLAGEVSSVYATLRQLNPDIAGEDAGTILFEFRSGAHGVWDANRFNESKAKDPRYTFGDVLVETNEGSLRLDHDGRMTIQKLGEPEQEHQYVHERRNFAGDCVYATQRHFVDCLLSSRPFETRGSEYLRTLQVQEAVYRSAASGVPVRDVYFEESSRTAGDR